MQDPMTPALELLSERGQNDAARALARCAVVLRHVDSEQRLAGTPPTADVIIHASEDVLTRIRHAPPPQGDWLSHIERALTDVLQPRFRVRDVQWTQTEPADMPRSSAHATAGGERAR